MFTIANLTTQLSKRVKLLVGVLFFVPLYFLYIGGLTRNPPGFYMDEAAVAYSAYTMYLRGEGEFGQSWPLYFPIFSIGNSTDYLNYSDPTQIYLLAALFHVFQPGVFLSRALSATAVFLAALVLGSLAKRISGQGLIGTIVALTALMTPWLFELGRVAFGAALYPLAISLFLTALYRAHSQERWSNLDSVVIGLTLAMATYTYTVGRLLGPLLGLGLVLFATDLKRFKDVFRTWVAYGIFLIPLLIFHLRNPNALAGRFKMSVGNIKPDLSVWENITRFFDHYLQNVSPWRLLFTGDPILRHHITDTAAFLAPVFILCLIGLIVVILRYRSNAWWRFIIFGILVIPVPASLTIEIFHSLRLSALPVFLLVLTVPALMWLLERTEEATPAPSWLHNFAARPARSGILMILLVCAVVQAIFFQISFREIGPGRGRWFDDAYPRLFAAAIAEPSRPIYLVGQSYIHAYWQAAVQGVDQSNFVKLDRAEGAPAGSLILSSEEKCSDCELKLEDGGYLLYRKLNAGEQAERVQEPSVGETDALRGRFSKPRGIAVDRKGNTYVADTGNARIQKFSPKDEFLANFGKSGSREGELTEPVGVTIDAAGNIYVTDSSRNRLLKFDHKGTFVKEWKGPDPGFYGPRDLVAGPDMRLYILDQGRSRVVRFDPVTETSEEWGRSGAGEGEFGELTGIATGGNRIYVADALNDRIQVFDLSGKFINRWPVPQWDKYIWHFPDVEFDEESNRVFVTSGWTNEVLVFDADGSFLESLKSAPPAVLDNPSSLAISKSAKGLRLYVLNTVSVTEDSRAPSVSFFELSGK
jgi:DNA-binding beta-propeller fold protein YncE